MAKQPLSITHPEIAAQWHPTLNDNLTPNDVTAGSGKKVWWQCPVSKDHVWQATVEKRTQGRGCPCCAGRLVVLSNCLATTHPDIAAQWHPTLNGGLTPNDVTAGSIKKVWWQCPVSKDHVWQARVNDRTSNGSNCACCAGRLVVPSNCLATTHPELAKQWHPTLNGNLTPNDVTAGCNKKVWWQCEKDHVWQARVNDRTSGKGKGCPTCNESKGEKAIREHLKKLGVVHTPQWQFKNAKISKQSFDLGVKHPEFTGVIEFQGIQHFIPTFGGSSKEQQFENCIERDDKKFKWCQRHKIPLLIISYWDMDRIPKILDDVLVGRTPFFSKPPQEVRDYKVKRERIRHRLGIKEPEVLCGLFNFIV